MFNRRLEELVLAMRLENAALNAKLVEIEKSRAIAQNNFEWARIRMNQMEEERSALFFRVANIQLPPMQIERSGQQSMAESKPLLDELMKKISFEDLGDDEARRQGVDHEKE